MIRKVWGRVRSIVPISMYPMLAPMYKWERKRSIKKLRDLDAEYLSLNPAVLVPDAEMRYNVVGPCTIEQFMAGGRSTANDIERCLATAPTVGSALDFGCGCGRLLLEASRRWPGVKWSGTDVDVVAVDWCRAHLSMQVDSNAETPPLRYANGEFDLIWCGSVFTHLDEERQDVWLKELMRILKPGGRLLASVHGQNCWKDLPVGAIRKILNRGIIHARTGCDEGIHPDWYQTTWHTQEYIRKHWAQFVEIIDYVPRGFDDNQDVVVCGQSEC